LKLFSKTLKADVKELGQLKYLRLIEIVLDEFYYRNRKLAGATMGINCKD
jgi:hypothetical protein